MPEEPTTYEAQIHEDDSGQIAAQTANIFVHILKAGKSKNGFIYEPAILMDAAPMFEGATAFADHGDGRHRSVRDVIGSYSQAAYNPQRQAITATLRVIDPTIGAMLRRITEDRAAGRTTPRVGLSVDMICQLEHGPDNTRLVRSIQHVNSVDIVFDPSAGGELIAITEHTQEEIRTMNTQPPAEPAATPPAAPVIEAAPPAAPPAPDPLAQIAEARRALCADILTARLSASNLPESMQTLVRNRFAGQIFEAATLDAELANVRQALGALTAGTTINQPGTQRITGVRAMRDRIQTAADMLFGNEVSEQARANTPRPRGLRELFEAAGFDGNFGWEGRVIEANEVTTSVMANIVGTSMTKRLVANYRSQPKWWKPFVVEVPLRDMKTQTRIRLNDFAALSTVNEDAAYTNLAWDDAAETYTPTKKGNLVHVTLETIINDDLRAVQSIPMKLARAAAITVNEAISALFTANSGEGSQMADTYNVFDASNHQSNLGSAALDATTLTAAQVAVSKMTDTASKRLGLTGKWLLVPPDLQYTAFTLAYSQLKPGTADNDINAMYGRVEPIIVPQFTDTNNWYLLAAREQIELIEIGYLDGAQDPELMVQSDPLSGAVFTHDAINYKARHIYGAAWLDYRGAYGAVVA